MPSLKLSEICEFLAQNGIQATVEGEDVSIQAVNTLQSAVEGELTFLSNPKYLAAVRETRASAVIARAGVELREGQSALRCDDPYAAVTAAIIAIHGYRQHPRWGLSERACVHPTATIGANANIAENVTIAAGASVGENCTIYPGCYVAERARIGDGCTLFPNVVVYDGCELGDRVTVHAGTVIGQDGLGYAPVDGKWVKIPQVGRTVIGDDVEIGANCAIDRATLGATEVGAGTKFGNVVVIGHGTRVGPDCMFVGLVGVAGSVTIGRHVTLAGQVGVAGHLKIGDDATAAAKTGITKDIGPNETVIGAPAVPIDRGKRVLMASQKLPEALKRLKELEREVKRLSRLAETP